MRYFRAKESEYTRNVAYGLYVTKGIEIIVGSVGAKMVDFAEIIELKQVDNRSGDDIAADIISKAGLFSKKGGDES